VTLHLNNKNIPISSVDEGINICREHIYEIGLELKYYYLKENESLFDLYCILDGFSNDEFVHAKIIENITKEEASESHVKEYRRQDA